MSCIKENNKQVDMLGYAGLTIICFRMIPPILYSVYNKERVNISTSFLFMEILGCSCYIVYSRFYKIYLVMFTNLIILLAVIFILFYNNCCNFSENVQLVENNETITIENTRNENTTIENTTNETIKVKNHKIIPVN